jgi:AcrR family transcriptional regulator
MARTRTGVLAAAAVVVAERGTRRASMTDIAATAGIAKGTLYNHFRTKDEVWAALAEAEVRRLAAECQSLPLAAALRHAAERIAAHPIPRRLAEDEPAVLAQLLTAGEGSAGWSAASAAVVAALAQVRAGAAASDLVLRWLVSHLILPAGPADPSVLLAVVLAGPPDEAAQLPGGTPAAPGRDPQNAVPHPAERTGRRAPGDDEFLPFI